MTPLAPQPLTTEAADSKKVYRWLLWAGAGSLLLRFWLAVSFPITGDEAFFYWWGVYPDWGYYDHPPMVGWVIALMRVLLGDTVWAIRLPAVLLPLIVGGGLWWALKPVNPVRAAWAVLLFWLAPTNWLLMFITTDIPLMAWSAFSVAALMHAERRAALDRRAYALYALSGLLLGCAFLSKYFAAVLGLTYLVYFVLYRRQRWTGLLLLVLCAVPAAIINIDYNMSHGWSNIMFNVYNRNADEVFAWSKPLTYLGMMFYLVTPVVAWVGWRQRKALTAAARQHRLLACLVLVPFLFFLFLAAKKVIGLHWVLSFYPFGFAFLAFALAPKQLATCAKGLALFTALHVLVVAGLYTTHLDTWRTVKPLSRIYPQVIRSYQTAQILDKLSSPGVVLMADAYTPASIYGFERRTYMPVFGVGRFHARQDDMLVDFSVYQGKTIRVIMMEPPDLSAYAPYFDAVQTIKITQSGVNFYAVEGSNFKYETYRAQVLGDIFKSFYNIPSFLSMTGCPFCERYCGKVRCPK